MFKKTPVVRAAIAALGGAMALTALPALAQTQAPQRVEGREGDQVHQPVPAHRQRAQLQGDGVELRVGEDHGADRGMT